jgi:ribosome-binding protein aMBF1 (putative translation factor)
MHQKPWTVLMMETAKKKCENCGTENVPTQPIQVGKLTINVCGTCYSQIEASKAEKEHYEMKKKYRFRMKWER